MGEAAVGAAKREQILREFAHQSLTHALHGVAMVLEGHGFNLTSGTILFKSDNFEIELRQREKEPLSNIITPAQFGGVPK